MPLGKRRRGLISEAPSSKLLWLLQLLARACAYPSGLASRTCCCEWHCSSSSAIHGSGTYRCRAFEVDLYNLDTLCQACVAVSKSTVRSGHDAPDARTGLCLSAKQPIVSYPRGTSSDNSAMQAVTLRSQLGKSYFSMFGYLDIEN